MSSRNGRSTDNELVGVLSESCRIDVVLYFFLNFFLFHKNVEAMPTDNFQESRAGQLQVCRERQCTREINEVPLQLLL